MLSIAGSMSVLPERQEITQAFDRGRARWPGIALDFEMFARVLQARPPAPEGLLRYQEDVFLATACSAGEKAALEIFEREYLLPSLPTLRRFAAAPDFAAEVGQVVRTKLLCGPFPRIASYTACGPLLAWVRISLTRAAIDHLRATQAGPVATDIVDQVLAHGSTPEAHLLRANSQKMLRAAVESILKALSPRDRTLLRLHFLDGLSIDRIAPLFRIHRATVARRITSLRRELSLALHRALPDAQGNAEELRSLWRVFGSDVQLSLERLLKASLDGLPDSRGNRFGSA